ncbi:hypothetical protein ElyMa_003171700 [Elysia marginata]|uniref:EGF-like domain-containing protein n=1 Tax=Elysia marginata TaxID=1093978 RepID=A0AAV4IZG6_9GAST|nr:hypothetical protein ElyMa_003171700 [Elysia marginata]
MKIQVREADQGVSLLMTEMTQPYTVSTPTQYGAASMEWKTLVFKEDGITLALEVSVQCDEGFRDMFCSCEDRNTTQEHTMCTRLRDRVCLPGWAEPPGLPEPIKCLQSTLPCHPDNDPCQNNATCGTYKDGGTPIIVCSCLQDYTGQNCETHLTTTTTTTTTSTTTVTTTPSTTANQGGTTRNLATTTSNAVASNVNVTAAVVSLSPQPLITTTTVILSPSTSKASTREPTTTASTTVGSVTTTGSTTTQQSQQQQTTSTTPGGGVNTNQPGPRKGNDTTKGKAAQGNPGSGGSGGGGGGGGDNTPAIAGAVGGVVAALAASLVLFGLFRKKLCKKQQAAVSDVERDSVQEVKDENNTTESPQAEEGEEEVEGDSEIPSS